MVGTVGKGGGLSAEGSVQGVTGMAQWERECPRSHVDGTVRKGASGESHGGHSG